MTKDTLEYWLKVVGSVIAAGSLLLGAAQFIRNQTVEAAKPYLQSKLKWCEEAVETASAIATADAGRDGRSPCLTPAGRRWPTHGLRSGSGHARALGGLP